MTIYIVNEGRDARRAASIESRLRKGIPSLVKIDRLENISRQSANDRAYIVLVLAPQDRTYVKNFLDAASRYGDELFFIIMGDEISASEYKALLRTGRADWISADAEANEILEIVARTSAERATSARDESSHKATVVSLVPSVGGAGNATLAAEVGVYLCRSKTTRNHRLCIVDLDFQASHICDYLDIEPRLQIQEISNNPERLDAHLFEIFISRHSSGVHVFAAPRSKFDMCDLNIAALDRFFEMVSARYDLMIIDLPPIWFAWTSQIIFASDGILVTGLNTIPSLRQTVGTVSAVREVARPDVPVAVVVNRCQRHLVRGIARRRHVETLLGNEKVFYVGEEPMATQSINSGSPMALTNSYRAIRKDIVSLATFCSDLKSLSVSVS